MVVNLYLDKKSQKSTKAIYFYVRGIVSRKVKVFHSGEFVLQKHWDAEKQVVKSSHTSSLEINARLSALKSAMLNAYRQYSTLNPNASYEEVLKCIGSVLKVEDEEVEKVKTMLEYYEEFLKIRSANYSLNSVKRHRTLIAHIQQYQLVEKRVLYLNDFNTIQMEKIAAYFITVAKITNNTLTKYIMAIKTLLHWCYERGYMEHQKFAKFQSPPEMVDIVYLTEEELNRISTLDLSASPYLERVRDMFCFQCYTGQRYCDVAKFEYNDVKDGVWYLRTAKTKDIIKIPLTTKAKEILAKYEVHNRLPVISAQKTNDFIKEVAKRADVNSIETITRYRGSEKIESKQPKWAFVSTHTARRTFVTLSLEKGMRPETVMKITGHKDYKTFKKYIKLTDKVAEQEMKKFWE